MSPSRIVTSDLSPDPNAIPNLDDIHENSWYNQDFDGYRITEQPLFTKRAVRVVCVGAGATGLEIAYKAERLLEKVDLQIYEKNKNIGGTWLENRYPGCTCDIPSHSYQFPWARNPNWTRYYSSSQEIWQYFKDISKKFGLEKYIKFDHKVESATWKEEEGVWQLSMRTSDGSMVKDSCEILVNSSGILNSWKYPDIPGLSSFKGKLMHSANWSSKDDVTGKTVAVVGGGSSAVQLIPEIQPYSEEQKAEFREDPDTHDKYCRELEGELNKRFTLMHLKADEQKSSRELVANDMKEQLNNDERLTNHMVPGFALGCRRMTPGSGYLQSLTKSNVEVLTQAVTRVTEQGIVDSSGIEHEVDIIVFATGFDTSFTPHFKCIGRDGRVLKEEFGDFPKAYMSIMAEGFPNLFLFLGPNSPVSHSSLLPIVDWHSRYMFDMITKLQEENIKCYDPKKEAVRDLFNHTHELMKRLVWSSACRSWFKNGKQVGPVTAIYPGSRLHYFETMKKVRYEDYNITYRSDNRYQFWGNGYTMTEMDPDGNPVWYFDDPFVQV